MFPILIFLGLILLAPLVPLAWGIFIYFVLPIYAFRFFRTSLKKLKNKAKPKKEDCD